jgi:TonB-dependent starch-binding outer membrane protein SusC
VSDKSAPLADQARTVAIRDLGAQRTYAGFIEDGSFVRFRELSVTWSPADDFARRFLKGRSASVTFAGRNLKLWSDYSGIDPEMVYGTSSIQNEFQTAPPPTTLTLRVNLGF